MFFANVVQCSALVFLSFLNIANVTLCCIVFGANAATKIYVEIVAHVKYCRSVCLAATGSCKLAEKKAKSKMFIFNKQSNSLILS